MYEDQVKKGAALLDRVRPGWAKEIAVKHIRMASCDDCVLGQIYGQYDHGLSGIASGPLDDDELARWSRDHGFTLSVMDTCYFGALANTWRAEIRGRTEAS